MSCSHSRSFRLCLVVAAVAAGAVVALLPGRAQAFCGFFVAGSNAKLTNNASQVVLMRKGNRTVMTMSNNYQGPPENFAMVVPVPVVLRKEDVKTLPVDVFDRVDSLSAPRLVEYWELDPCRPPLLGGTGRLPEPGLRRVGRAARRRLQRADRRERAGERAAREGRVEDGAALAGAAPRPRGQAAAPAPEGEVR